MLVRCVRSPVLRARLRQAMNALIEQCRRLGVRLWVEGGALAYDAPKGAMTSKLAAALKADKPAILAALAHPDPLSPLTPAAEARRPKVLALARDEKRYAVYVEDPNTDPAVMALATSTPANLCISRRAGPPPTPGRPSSPVSTTPASSPWRTRRSGCSCGAGVGPGGHGQVLSITPPLGGCA